jgi:hypothetical protein
MPRNKKVYNKKYPEFLNRMHKAGITGYDGLNTAFVKNAGGLSYKPVYIDRVMRGCLHSEKLLLKVATVLGCNIDDIYELDKGGGDTDGQQDFFSGETRNRSPEEHSDDAIDHG